MSLFRNDDGASTPVVIAIVAVVVIVAAGVGVALLSGGEDDDPPATLADTALDDEPDAADDTVPPEDDEPDAAEDTVPPEDDGSGGALDTLPPGTLETLPPGTLETLPVVATTQPPPPTPDDVRTVLGPLLGDDKVDDAFQSLQAWPNVTTFDRLPDLSGPALNFDRSGLFEITADQQTLDRWDAANIPHPLSDEFLLFVGMLDAPPLAEDGIDRQLGLVVSDGDDVPPDLGAGHLGSSAVYFAQAALDPDAFGDGWVPMTGFDVADGFRPIDTGASGFIEFGNATTAVLVPQDEVGDSILSGLIFGRLTGGEPANDRQPATTRTVTLLLDPFGDRIPPLPPPGRAGDCQPGDNTACLLGRFAVTGTSGGTDGEVKPGDGDDISELTYEELVIRLGIKNGCDINNHFWVFAAASTDVEYTLTVTDTVTGSSRSYGSDPFLGQPSPAITDTAAFATCP